MPQFTLNFRGFDEALRKMNKSVIKLRERQFEARLARKGLSMAYAPGPFSGSVDI